MTAPIKTSEKIVYLPGLAAGISWHTTEDGRDPQNEETLSTDGFTVRGTYGIGYNLTAESCYKDRDWLLEADRRGADGETCGFADQYCGGSESARVVGIQAWSNASFEEGSKSANVGGSVVYGYRLAHISVGGGYQFFNDEHRPNHPIVTVRGASATPLSLFFFMPITAGVELATDPTDGFFQRNYSVTLNFSFASTW